MNMRTIGALMAGFTLPPGVTQDYNTAGSRGREVAPFEIWWACAFHLYHLSGCTSRILYLGWFATLEHLDAMTL